MTKNILCHGRHFWHLEYYSIIHLLGCHDTQHNGTRPNNTRDYKDDKLSIMTIDVIYCYAECHYDQPYRTQYHNLKVRHNDTLCWGLLC
jgi:hypothetical protein